MTSSAITATRDYTGGSLGYTPKRHEGGSSLYPLQFTGKTTWYLIALAVWVVGLCLWHLVDRSMLRYALEAIAAGRGHDGRAFGMLARRDGRWLAHAV
jgi:hypothetical protein